MGKANVVLYVVVICSLGITSTILAFGAEATRIKVSEITTTPQDTCVYPKTSANIIGYTAAVFALISQIIISVVARCACCNKSSNNSTAAILCFVFSWITCVIGIGALNTASNLSTRQEYLDDSGLCYTVKAGVFAAGGVFVLVATILGLLTYRATFKYSEQEPSEVSYEAGVAMGTPQYPNFAPSPYPYTKE